MSQGRLTIVGLLLAVATASAANGAEKLSIQRRGKNVFLRHGPDRLLLLQGYETLGSVWGPRGVSVSGGYWLSLPAPNERDAWVRLSRNGKALGGLSLSDAMVQLDAREEWGLADVSGGYDISLTCATTSGNGILAILTLNASGPSSRPVFAQCMIRFTVQPNLEMELLRTLDVPEGWHQSLSAPPFPRLFRFAEHLMLYTDAASPRATGRFDPKVAPRAGKLLEIDREGKTIRTLAVLPPRRYPIGVLNNRWLLLGEPDEHLTRPLSIYDLKRGKLLPLPGDPERYAFPDQLFLPASGARFLWSANDSNRTSLVSVPSGARVRLPRAHFLWKCHLLTIGDENRSVSVYNLKGRRLNVMPIPPEAP